MYVDTFYDCRKAQHQMQRFKTEIIKSFFNSKENNQKKEYVSYFEVKAMILTISVMKPRERYTIYFY